MSATKSYNVGVVGFLSQKFDEEKALNYIDKVEKIFLDKNPNLKINDIACISGLTDLGIPALAYREAQRRGWTTVGVACEKANEFDLFDVDEKYIVGQEWGDESNTFLNMIDMMVRIGGGKQSKKEVEEAKNKGIKVLEFELSAK